MHIAETNDWAYRLKWFSMSPCWMYLNFEHDNAEQELHIGRSVLGHRCRSLTAIITSAEWLQYQCLLAIKPAAMLTSQKVM